MSILAEADAAEVELNSGVELAGVDFVDLGNVSSNRR